MRISLVAETSRRLYYCAVHEMVRAQVLVQHSQSIGVVLAFSKRRQLCLGGKKRAAVVFAVDAMLPEQRSLFLKHISCRGQVNTSKVVFYGIAESL